MRTPVKLGLYGGALAVVFAASGFAANAIVPEDAVQDWEAAAQHEHAEEDQGMDATGHADHGAAGLGLEAEGYRLDGVSAPDEVGEEGTIALTILDPAGAPVTDFETSHEQELHLILVRADGAEFAHAHPEMDAEGEWTLPWTWEAAGAYRLYADIVPAGGEAVTLSTTVQVAGDYSPERFEAPVAEASVDGFDVALEGDLLAGESSPVSISVSRDGEPVDALEPYMGAYGHLVALRQGDLAYLHVHPQGEEPAPGETGGPTVDFAVTAPTAGAYLLYLDFQVDGQVHTAGFVVDAAAGGHGGDAQENGEDHEH